MVKIVRKKLADGSIKEYLYDSSAVSNPKRLSRIKREQVGIVYFLRAGDQGPVKIGFTFDYARRFFNLQSSHYEKLVTLAVFMGRRFDEHRLHRILSRHKIRGEWLRPDPQVFREMELLKKELQVVKDLQAVANAFRVEKVSIAMES